MKSVSATILLFLLLTGPAVLWAGSFETLHTDQTIESVQGLLGLSAKDAEELRNVIAPLSYRQQRLLRALSALQDAPATPFTQLVDLASSTTISFDHISLVESYASLEGASLPDCRVLLTRLSSTSFVHRQVIATLPRVALRNVDQFNRLLRDIATLSEEKSWAAQALLAFPAVDPATLFPALELIQQMGPAQSRAAEKLLLVPDLTRVQIIPALQGVMQANEHDAIILRALAMQKQFRAATLTSWLSGYFRCPPKERDTCFLRLVEDDRSLLLGAFHQGALPFIWQINNLHDVTDANGSEIGLVRLAALPPDTFAALFDRLHPTTRHLFHREFRNAMAASRQQAIGVLQRATAHARKQAGEDLSSTNIYALLVQGGELYDSSFRDILVPILHRRIAERSRGQLLKFLADTDPDHLFVANFITNLAHRGKLTIFLPQNTADQCRVVRQVMESAVLGPENLLLFAATFTPLLQALAPEAGAFLIDLMLARARQAEPHLQAQLQMILQYYLEATPHLLTGESRAGISSLIAENGAIDLAPYGATPFAQWKQDGLLQSLSVFQADDDGRSSYLSFSRSLLEHGYRPTLSTAYPAWNLPADTRRQAELAMAATSRAPADALVQLFRQAHRSGLAIDWHKRVNSLEIRHTVQVYQDAQHQKNLLRTFLTQGHEIYVQRGHSYWRHEQLFEPLEALKKERGWQENPKLQRFVILGSCGGIRAYTDLGRIFGDGIDILATVGTGRTTVNNPYSRQLLELAASVGAPATWEGVQARMGIAATQGDGDYIQPGSLPAILHKMMAAQMNIHDTD